MLEKKKIEFSNFHFLDDLFPLFGISRAEKGKYVSKLNNDDDDRVEGFPIRENSKKIRDLNSSHTTTCSCIVVPLLKKL